MPEVLAALGLCFASNHMRWNRIPGRNGAASHAALLIRKETVTILRLEDVLSATDRL